MKIGKLREVNIRDLWKHEQYDFSNWLSQSENISALNEILGLNLVDVSTETFVGSYRCDLYAIDELTGAKVVIENQLEPSNHEHLGKAITYASGLDAKFIVWIVSHARQEHWSAVEWLNNNTNDDVNIFLIELHAYKIGDSLPAPYFEVIEKPNDFIKVANNNSDRINKSKHERLEFWNRFNEILTERGKPFNMRKATTDHWYDIAIGSSNSHLKIELVNKEGYIRIGAYMSDDKEIFDKLYEKRNMIENEMGLKLDWVRESTYGVSRIKYELKGLNFDNHSNYDKLINKIIDIATRMQKVFKKYM